jgi:hypothetical protein
MAGCGMGEIVKMKRAIKVDELAYQQLVTSARKEKRSIEEVASEIILSSLAVSNSTGEQYDAEGKRIFRR